MPAGENHLLGYVFFQFEGSQWVNDYRSFPNKMKSDHYLDGAKKDLLIRNLEHFTNAFRLGEPLMSEMERDSFQKIVKGVAYLLEIKNRTRIPVHVGIIKKLNKFMKVIIKGSAKGSVGHNYMMYKLIQDYCDAEIQNQGQTTI